MHTVIQTGGKQYRVKAGDKIKIEKIDAPVGSKINIPNVLMSYDGKDVNLDPKVLKKATVDGKIISHGKNKKVIIFKKKRRKGYQKKSGHRQEYTEIQIEKINLSIFH